MHIGKVSNKTTIQKNGTFLISTHIKCYQYCFPYWKAGKLIGLVKRNYLYRLLLIGSAWI